MKKFLLGCAALACTASPAFAQMHEIHTEAQVSQVTAPAVRKIEVNQDGSLSGRVFANVAGANTPVDAKVTLASEGVVIEAVQTENGSFSFANISPGSYTLTGATAGYAGGQTFDVAPYAGTGCASCSLGLQSTSAPVYYHAQSSPVYNAPVSACQSCAASNGGGIAGGQGIAGRRFGGGGFGGGGFGGGGFGGGRFGAGGGGLLSGRGLLRAGLIGGVIAIAVDDDDDDVSPDQ